ncbi:unnamed protein product [Rotaria sordida]|uniref:Uncharacterized protein n=1 Tax=Rotaria sordida TaxID=392033 RepID=A0A819LJ49_9BILA|nr:unnamed protein product [Rotaria sordida]CAF1114835.1 unnamed protein product [Rotaria sordida]CAF1119054.1 unnamed protein product [Rotaria sordida]CAF1299870.1 unnamed protein product [Rotaria sordida]CAF1392304.1 unnamed protein product [Rotaria sordida]
MAAVYELEDPSSAKNQRLKSLRLIELSDHIIRLNRRENTQLELRLNQLKRQETVIRRKHDREIYWKRLQLERIYETLHDSPTELTDNFRMQTPMSFHAVRMQRNQSAPPNIKRTQVENKSQSRPNTTPTAAIRRDKRALSAFKEITLKPTCRTLGNLLVLLDSEKYFKN